MPTVNFYLKKPEPLKEGVRPRRKPGTSLIRLHFIYDGKKFVYTFGQTINPNDWNSSKQRVKSNKQTVASGDHSLNETLDDLKKVCERTYKEELRNGIPDPARLKEALDTFLNRNSKKKKDAPTFHELIDKFIAGEIKIRRGKKKGRARERGTCDNYKALKYHLVEFGKAKNHEVTFDSINQEFFDAYTAYLENDLKLSHNTIAKNIRTLKVIMSEAYDSDYTTNQQFTKSYFSYAGEETEAVYLNEFEIMTLFKHDFSDNKKLEQVRDLFVFGCHTGLRYSDYSNIGPENITTINGKKFIKIITQKTNETVIIPCSDTVLTIFDKYKMNPNSLPRAISSQKFNDYLKDVCKDAGMVETGRLINDPELPLFKCISSHTARRSFATNYHLSGFSTIELMKITGHKTEKAFLKYVKVSKQQAAERLSAHMEMRGSKMLKVAG